MTRPIRTLVGAVATAMLITLAGLAALPASAITGGEPDGEGHPNVALIVFYDATGRFRCSATLASPTVLITAAHCTSGTARQDCRDLPVHSSARRDHPRSRRR